MGNWTWVITCRVGVAAVRIGADTSGTRISSRWTCRSLPGRRASHREMAVQTKRILDNMQIKASCVGVTAFDTSMGRIPLSKLFAIKNCIHCSSGRDENDKNPHRIVLVGSQISGPKASSSTTQSNDDIDKNKVSLMYMAICLLLVINFFVLKSYYPIYTKDI